MANIKPLVRQGQILNLLKKYFDRPIQELAPLQGGQIAQTFSFRVGEQEYILRFNHNNMGASFYKEQFIYQNFASHGIPIPPIVCIGRLGDLIYAISLKMPGRSLETLHRAAYEQVLPSIVHTLYLIHQVNVSSQQNYGLFNNQGIGLSPSWKSYIASVREEEEPGGFYGKWHEMFQTTFLERDFFDKVYNHMLRLLHACPEERYLVHGNYGYNNVLADNGKVSAVLDWIDAKYGDFVFDIAEIDYWARGFDFPEIFRQYYTKQGIPLPFYEERIACYKCYLGLDGMRFFAKTGNQTAYRMTCEIVEKQLKV